VLSYNPHSESCKAKQAITAIKAALAQPEQEPVAFLSTDSLGERYLCFDKPQDDDPVQPLYAHPPQRTWVGLTGEMLLKAAQSSLSPEQYDHFEAMSKYQPDIYDRLAYAIRVQDE
jgi:hypothetical protein